jgi:hypothetical protein
VPARDVGHCRHVLIDSPGKPADITVDAVRYSRKLQVESWSTGNEKLAQLLRGSQCGSQLCCQDQTPVDRDKPVAIGCHEADKSSTC